MILKYDTEITDQAITINLRRLTNQIYKLLPTREEALDWQKPLLTILEELSGMSRLFLHNQDIFFSLLCKLEGLFTLTKRDDFMFFRKTIFECLNLVNELNDYVKE